MAATAVAATFATAVLLMWYRHAVLHDVGHQWRAAIDDSLRMVIIGAVTAGVGVNRWPIRNSMLIVVASIASARVVFVGLAHVFVQIPLVQILAYYPATLGCMIISGGVGVAALMASTKTIAKAANRGV